jgi:hypothetical protein
VTNNNVPVTIFPQKDFICDGVNLRTGQDAYKQDAVHSQTEEPDQKVSPSIYAALIDSLFQNPAPLFAGASWLPSRRHDRVEDGSKSALGMRCASYRERSCPRARMHWYNGAQIVLTADEAAAGKCAIRSGDDLCR